MRFPVIARSSDRQIVEIFNNPDLLFDEDVLPEFSLDLRSL